MRLRSQYLIIKKPDYLVSRRYTVPIVVFIKLLDEIISGTLKTACFSNFRSHDFLRYKSTCDENVQIDTLVPTLTYLGTQYLSQCDAAVMNADLIQHGPEY